MKFNFSTNSTQFPPYSKHFLWLCFIPELILLDEDVSNTHFTKSVTIIIFIISVLQPILIKNARNVVNAEFYSRNHGGKTEHF